MTLLATRLLQKNVSHREIHGDHSYLLSHPQVFIAQRKSVKSEPQPHQESGWRPCPTTDIEPGRAEECDSARRDEKPVERHQPIGRAWPRHSQPVSRSNWQVMKHEQIPTDRPKLQITLGFNPLEVSEEARAKRVHRQDTKRQDANMHESAVYHRAVSSHF